MTTDAAPVRLEGVFKRFGRGHGMVTALEGVSLSFPAGSFTAVLGASGSGKSTLLQCAAGLERPSAGTVRLCGTDLARLSDRRQTVLRRERVGFVFQDLNLLPELSVGENIALPLRLGPRLPARRRARRPRRARARRARAAASGIERLAEPLARRSRVRGHPPGLRAQRARRRPPRRAHQTRARG